MNFWTTERSRIALVLIATFLGGQISGFWLASLTISLLFYVAWLLWNLHKLHQWLQSGGQVANYPDIDGVWGDIAQHVLDLQKTSLKRKNRTRKLLKRFQGIVSGLPYATLVLNERNEIDWANAASKDFLNIDVKKDRGQRLENLLRIPEIHQILTSKTNKEFEITINQNVNRQLALQFVWVQKDLKLIIARDISERVHTQEMRKNFIANASHELRTPLTVISGYLEMLSIDEQLDESMRLTLISAIEQADKMQSITNDLLMLSNLENTELNKDTNSEVNLPELLHNICDDEQMLIKNNNHTLKVLYPQVWTFILDRAV